MVLPEAAAPEDDCRAPEESFRIGEKSSGWTDEGGGGGGGEDGGKVPEILRRRIISSKSPLVLFCILSNWLKI